jgi:hypothetical protein
MRVARTWNEIPEPEDNKMCGHQKQFKLVCKQVEGLRGPCNVQADVLQEDHEGHEELHLKYQESKYLTADPIYF